jgi:hypothetical protein
MKKTIAGRLRRDAYRHQGIMDRIDSQPSSFPHFSISISSILRLRVSRIASGGVVGFAYAVRPIQPTAAAVTFKSADEVTRELNSAISSVVPSSYKTQVLTSRLIYYEQGQRFVQPAYEFHVRSTNSKGSIIGHRVVIAAAQEPPEPIDPLPSPPSAISLDSLGKVPQTPSPATGKPDPTIQLGFYFDRLDYNGWATDPWQFWEYLQPAYSLGAAGGSAPGGYSFNLTHFQFNFPWMWQTNLSSSFIDESNFAMISGHGNHFLMASFQDWGDLIYVTQTAGYGAFNPNKGLTDYIVWRGCLVIPTPDPADGLGAAADAVTPWFNVFKGLRGTYGFHSEMGIEELEGANFGTDVGLGFPVLSEWFGAVTAADSSCAATATPTTSEWMCPSAVIVTGHENDTIFDLDPVQSPESLTVWWESPGQSATSASVP